MFYIIRGCYHKPLHQPLFCTIGSTTNWWLICMINLIVLLICIYSYLTSCILCGFDQETRQMNRCSKNYGKQCPVWVFQFASDRICGTQPYPCLLPSPSCVSEIYTKTLKFSKHRASNSRAFIIIWGQQSSFKRKPGGLKLWTPCELWSEYGPHFIIVRLVNWLVWISGIGEIPMQTSIYDI